MLSVLVPVFNYNVVSLVRVVFEQAESTGITFEIIILDDASTDVEAIRANQTLGELPCCRYFQSEKNRGRTATRNFLAEKAQYDRLLFMDADVMPKRNDFVRKMIENTMVDVVFGGITYEETKPEKDKMLRWKYGRYRECRLVSERLKKPYISIISGAILIEKEVFLKANSFFVNRYGIDVLFAVNIMKQKAVVLHIDNPVVHLGLESNLAFIEKTKKAMESISIFANEGKIPEDFGPVQKAYLRLKKYKLLSLFNFFVKTFESLILKNLRSSNPSLFLFDLYKLNYFAQLKR